MYFLEKDKKYFAFFISCLNFLNLQGQTIRNNVNNLHISPTFSDLESLIPHGQRVFVVIDNNLRPFFSLFERYEVIPIQTSEKAKTLATVEYITEILLEKGADRNSFLIGVGGGITTDLCGFVAAVYKRGIRFGFVPTTLLAQVDASIGGKNGVNFHAYKNMIGTITQPEWIYICTEVLRTLPPREFRAGIAEVLKTFILFDAEYYRKAVDYFTELEAVLQNTGSYCRGDELYKQEELTDLIRKTALYKCGVVERDTFEKGERRLLNLGHTFAHAIEKNCPIMHGEAVAIGLVLAAEVSERLGLAPEGLATCFAEDLKKVGLPTQPPVAIGVLLEALEKDKKVEGDAIHFILPRAVGDVVDRTIPLKQLEEIARDLR